MEYENEKADSFSSAAYRATYLFIVWAAVWYELNSKAVANAYLQKGYELTVKNVF